MLEPRRFEQTPQIRLFNILGRPIVLGIDQQSGFTTLNGRTTEGLTLEISDAYLFSSVIAAVKTTQPVIVIEPNIQTLTAAHRLMQARQHSHVQLSRLFGSRRSDEDLKYLSRMYGILDEVYEITSPLIHPVAMRIEDICPKVPIATHIHFKYPNIIDRPGKIRPQITAEWIVNSTIPLLRNNGELTVTTEHPGLKYYLVRYLHQIAESTGRTVSEHTYAESKLSGSLYGACIPSSIFDYVLSEHERYTVRLGPTNSEPL